MYGSKMGLEQNKDISMDGWKLENMKTFWMNYKPLSLKLCFSHLRMNIFLYYKLELCLFTQAITSSIIKVYAHHFQLSI